MTMVQTASLPMPLVADARSPRELVLRDLAVEVGQAWAKGWLSSLANEGRAVEGGWPGVVSDARARIRELAARALVRLAMPALDHAELARLTHITYDEARRVWRSRAVPES